MRKHAKTHIAVATAALLLLAFAPTAFAAKGIDSHLLIGQDPRDIAANEASGDIYAVSRDGDHVDRFSSDGTLELRWGKDVIAGNANTGYERCIPPADCKSGASAATSSGGVDFQVEGVFQKATGIAIDQADGSVYVWDARRNNNAEAENLRVQKFDHDGNFILMFGKEVNATTGGDVCTESSGHVCKAGLESSEPGGFGNPSVGYPGLAVSPVDGDVFVADPLNNRIQRFQPNGVFVDEFGTAADFSTRQPRSVAIDSRGIVYAADGEPLGASEIERYDAYGVHGPADFMSPIASPPLLAATDDEVGSGSSRTTRIEVDPDSDGAGADVDRLHVLRNPDAEGAETVVQQFDSPGEVAAPGAVSETHGVGDGFASISGFGLNSAAEELYISGDQVSGDQGIWVLREGGDGIEAPEVSTPTTANVTATTADLTAEIDPNGGQVTYRFEHSPDGVEWTAMPTRTLSGDVSQQVDEAVTGLGPNSGYRARIIVSKLMAPRQTTAFGGTEALFNTLPAPPSVITLATAVYGPQSATIFGRVNPNNSPTEYWFEWGETASYGNRVPVPNGDAGSDFASHVLTEQLEGLQADTTYHYRIVADNGVEAEPGVTEVAGEDMTFTTREALPASPRAYEMVTPPFKATRSVVGTGMPPGENPNLAQPSLDGDTVHWATSFFPLSEDVGAPGTGDTRIIRRTSDGWVNSTLNTLKLDLVAGQGTSGTQTFVRSQSGDLESVAWDNAAGNQAPFLRDANEDPILSYTRRDGTGLEGWNPWLTNVAAQVTGEGLSQGLGSDSALFNDDGSAMLRWGHYRGLAEDPETAGDEDPSDEQQLHGSGSTAYLQRAADPDELPTAAKDLVSECTGTDAGDDATLIPMRNDNGTTGTFGDDHIDTQPCEAGSVVNERGAGLDSNRRTNTALAADGRRAFFLSPDPAPGTSGSVPSACNVQNAGGEIATGANTDCPPQLYVRQYDSSGEATVRWLSQAQGVGQQAIGMMGRTHFEGASRDGRYVYFRTSSPLLPGDPNGGNSITTGAAHDDSWDLYRYQLPASLDEDPAEGTLERISGGPSGEADPNADNDGVTVRFHSDDGKRAFFLTSAPIEGADDTPPAGGATAPGGTASSDPENLYLYDDSGAEPQWRFIARLPNRVSSGANLNRCASTGDSISGVIGRSSSANMELKGGNCWRGTPDGSAVAFFTGARLTDDDDDDAGDVYLYDTERDELVRLSAPPPGVAPYACSRSSDDAVNARCNGDLGWDSTGFKRGDFMKEFGRGWGGNRYMSLSTNPDGSYSVFFESRLPLLPEDEGESSWDVYEWRNGELSLISPGHATHDAYFSGNSVDGRDVFFETSNRIDPREIDDADYDIYDARRGSSGFAFTPPPVPCEVLALECESEAIAAPSPATPATLLPAAAGNVVSQRRGRPGCRPAARQAKKLAKVAKRARRNAKKVRSRTKSRKLRRNSRRFAKRAKALSKRAKRCRRANRNGRARR